MKIKNGPIYSLLVFTDPWLPTSSCSWMFSRMELQGRCSYRWHTWGKSGEKFVLFSKKNRNFFSKWLFLLKLADEKIYQIFWRKWQNFLRIFFQCRCIMIITLPQEWLWQIQKLNSYFDTFQIIILKIALYIW